MLFCFRAKGTTLQALSVLALALSAEAVQNRSGVGRILVARPTEVASIGPAPKAVILFTHLRRCGGTFLEDSVLKPIAVGSGTVRKEGDARVMLCKEGAFGRHHRLSEQQRRVFASDLAKAALVWRHCPFGAHALLPRERAYVYVTMLRRPLERMLSWFAYCDKYSPDKCHTGKYAVKPGTSKQLSFYATRRERHANLMARGGGRRHSVVQSTFHPNWLEYALDDNYATRMICGGDAHDADVPLAAVALDCAKGHLRTQYAFVGLLERQDESVCVLRALLGAVGAIQEAKGSRGPTTHSKGESSPADFREKFRDFVAHDNALYQEASTVFDEQLAAFPHCRP